MGRSKKTTRASTALAAAPHNGASPLVPTGIGPGPSTAPMLPTIPSGIGGGSISLTPIVSNASGSPQVAENIQKPPDNAVDNHRRASHSPAIVVDGSSHHSLDNRPISPITSGVSIEESSAALNEQRRLRRAEKQRHHGADIPSDEDDIQAQQAILDSIRQRNKAPQAVPSAASQTAHDPNSYSGILEAALAHLMSPRHDDESDNDFALRTNALLRLRNPDRFNGTSHESSNQVSPAVPIIPATVENTSENNSYRHSKPLSMLVDSMSLSKRARSEQSAKSHYAASLFYDIPANSLTAMPGKGSAVPEKGFREPLTESRTSSLDPQSTEHNSPREAKAAPPELYAPAFTAEVDWQNRVAMQRERFRLIRTCGKSSIPDQNIGFDRDGLPFDRNGTEQAASAYSDHYALNRNPNLEERLPVRPASNAENIHIMAGNGPSDPGSGSSNGSDNSDTESGSFYSEGGHRYPEEVRRDRRRRRRHRSGHGSGPDDGNQSIRFGPRSEHDEDRVGGERRRRIVRRVDRESMNEEFQKRLYTMIDLQVGEACDLGLNKSMKLDPPVYGGSSKAKEFDEWIMKHLRFLSLSGLGGNDKDAARVKMLGICLEGKALNWYNDEVEQMHHAAYNLPRRHWTFKSIIWELYQHFVRGSSRNDSTQDFQSARYDASMGIQSLVSCLISAGSRMIRPPTDHEMSERIVDALPMSINRWLVEHRNVVASIISRRQLVKYIREYENLQDDIHFLEERQRRRRTGDDKSQTNRAATPAHASSSRAIPSSKTPARQDERGDRTCVRDSDRDRDRPRNGDRIRDGRDNRDKMPRPMICYGCNEKGHYANDLICKNYGKEKPPLRAIQEDTAISESGPIDTAVSGEQINVIADTAEDVSSPSLSDSDGDSCSIDSGDDFETHSDPGEERAFMIQEVMDQASPPFNMWKNDIFLDLLFYEPNEVDLYIETHMRYMDDSLRHLHNGGYELVDRVTKSVYYSTGGFDTNRGCHPNDDFLLDCEEWGLNQLFGDEQFSNNINDLSDDLLALIPDWSFIPPSEDPWGLNDVAPANGGVYPDLNSDIQWLDDFEEEVEDMIIDENNRKGSRFNRSLFFEKSFESNKWLASDVKKEDDSDDDSLPGLCNVSDKESELDDFYLDNNCFEDEAYFRGLWELDVPLEKVTAMNDALTPKKYVFQAYGSSQLDESR
ncbi:hypothetical protein C8J56DRAFT_896868 [Mycena floridula]|nr:hypothetical protein C8J56DRAFT_896868 [Mycena floridula]